VSPEEKQQLLDRFAPALHFDALERWRPGPVDRYLRHSKVLDGKEQPLPNTPPAEAAMNEYGNELKARLNPLDNFPDLNSQLRSNEVLRVYGRDQGLDSNGVAYGRVEPDEDSEDTFFLQYWLFYPDNPCVLPPGRHDGDWELVQIRIELADDGFEATQVTLAEHGKPHTQKVEAGRTKEGPEVFVAVDSHACYFTRGAQPMLPLSDTCQPTETVGTKPTVVPLPLAADGRDWSHWAGRWGMDGAAGTRIALRLKLPYTPPILRRLNFGAGESPPSPGQQSSWPSPKAFAESRAGAMGVTVALRRLAHFVGRLTWPREAPAVTVKRASDGRYTIEVKATGHLARRLTLVSIAFDEVAPSGARRALAMHSIKVRGPAKSLDIPHEGELVWHAAGYNFLRQRGEPVIGEPVQ
jgi:hypothetical protein